MDDGYTAATKAGRMSQDYRGGGLYGKFKRQCFKLLGAKKNVMVLNGANFQKFSSSLASKYTTTHSQVRVTE